MSHAKLHHKSSSPEDATRKGLMHTQNTSYHHYSLPLTLCNLTQCMVCTHHIRMYSMFSLTGSMNKAFVWWLDSSPQVVQFHLHVQFPGVNCTFLWHLAVFHTDDDNFGKDYCVVFVLLLLAYFTREHGGKPQARLLGDKVSLESSGTLISPAALSWSVTEFPAQTNRRLRNVCQTWP